MDILKNFYQTTTMLVLCVLLFAISCKQEKRGDFPKIVLTGETLKNESDIYSSLFIALVDSTLYMYTMRQMQDTLINVYQIQGDSLLPKYRFLPKGNGPYEGHVFFTLYDPDSRKLFLFENSGGLRYGYIIDINSEDSIHNTSSWRKIDFSNLENYRFRHSFANLNDSLLLAVGGAVNDRNILTIINLNTKEVIPLQFWIEDGFHSNDLVKQSVYMNNAQIFQNKKRNKFLYVCGVGRYMELFSINNNQITGRKIVVNVVPEYHVAADGISPHYQPTKYRGLRVTFTDDLIYAKRKEYTTDEQKGFKGYPMYYNDIVDVFDWDGNWVTSYQLDTPVDVIMIDPLHSNTLYALTCILETDETIIKKYILPEP